MLHIEMTISLIVSDYIRIVSRIFHFNDFIGKYLEMADAVRTLDPRLIAPKMLTNKDDLTDYFIKRLILKSYGDKLKTCIIHYCLFPTLSLLKKTNHYFLIKFQTSSSKSQKCGYANTKLEFEICYLEFAISLTTLPYQEICTGSLH